MLPDDLKNYLSDSSNLNHVCEVGEVQEFSFYHAKNIALGVFTASTSDHVLQGSLPTERSGENFEINGYDLIAEAEGYSADGLLIWFPSVKRYGFWDCDHYRVFLFEETDWTKIAPKVCAFVNSQWDPDLIPHSEWKPWER